MLKDGQTGLYHEQYFNELLAFEKKRLERSKRPGFVVLADLSAVADVVGRQEIAKSVMKVLSDATRDTDVKGWHVEGLVIGIVFTETTGKEALSPFVPRHIVDCLERLGSSLGAETFSRIQISCQAIPEEFPKRSFGKEQRVGYRDRFSVVG